MEIDSKPEELDRLERRLIQLKIEREALKKESDEASKRRLETLQSDPSGELEREYADLEEVWERRERQSCRAPRTSRKSSSTRQDRA